MQKLKDYILSIKSRKNDTMRRYIWYIVVCVIEDNLSEAL